MPASSPASAAFHTLPLTFKGLVVENTNRCNAKCDMCYQSSGPTGSDNWGLSKLDPILIERAIVQAQSIPAVSSRFHLAGGEAFIHKRECIDLFDFARVNGYDRITATTNCSWAKTLVSARALAKDLKRSGLTDIEISWDHWHRPYIKSVWIENAIRACREQFIHVNLRILTSKRHSLGEALSYIDAQALNRVSEISSGPVFPTGRAEKMISEEEIYHGDGLGGSCHSVLNLTVNSRGDVYPCCAGADQTKNLIFGNIKADSLEDIYSRMNSDPMLRVLVFHGVGALLPLIEDSDPIHSQKFSNICHLCWAIFSNDARARQVKDYFNLVSQSYAESIANSIRLKAS